MLLIFAILLSLYLVFLWLKIEFAFAVQNEQQAGAFFSAMPRTPDFVASGREPCRDQNPLGNPYFGSLHVHTSVSYDSASWQNTVTPAQSYAFMQGEPLKVLLLGDDPSDESLPTLRLSRPLDFGAVTDHAENFGEVSLCLNKNSAAYPTTVCRIFRGDLRLPIKELFQPLVRLISFALYKTERSARICGKDGLACISASTDVWTAAQQAAEDAYDRTHKCQFTSFVAYEYTLAEESNNLHRNIIFANATVPATPMSAKDAKKPEDLWRWLQATCLDSGAECDVLSIPHNSNWSAGRMFFPYTQSDLDIDEKRELSALRARLELLVEIMQVKGDSECRNGLSRVLGTADELCDFEKLRVPGEAFEDCGDGVGTNAMMLTGCLSRWSYARYALIQGLAEQRELGVNPYKFGIIAATDTHMGAGGAVEENKFMGSLGSDRTAAMRLRPPVVVPGIAKGEPTRYSSGGIAGIWAQENTRESLFAAMKRRETFGTSGPRIIPRFFAAWDYDAQLCDEASMIAQAYATGVPMGGTLKRPVMSSNQAKPSFLLSALKDGLPGATGLQKIQIIKGWMDVDGNMQQRVFDVVGDLGKPEASVNTDSCERLGVGYTSLCTVWRDEEFDPDIAAVYYARVVENPSCRWSAYDCNTFEPGRRPAACSDPNLDKVIQERAWTSPIWYDP